MRTPPEILVVGAGVSGLTTAICLAEAGYGVQVRARELSERTTSYAAGAIWGPYLVADERVLPWSTVTWAAFQELAREDGTGVRQVHGLEASRKPTSPPPWATRLPGFRHSHAEELPDGFTSGWWYTAPLLDMPRYLDYLRQRLRRAGGRVGFGVVESLPDAVAVASLAVNCTGAAARELVPDHQVTLTRGQLVVVENPGIERFFVEHDETPEPIYFLPHGDHLVLGGSAEPGRSDLEPDRAISAAIRRRCGTVDPALSNARVLEHRVGLRPSRPRVRLERQDIGRRHVIHNYGHGGAGITLSWGCAREVLDLANRL